MATKDEGTKAPRKRAPKPAANTAAPAKAPKPSKYSDEILGASRRVNAMSGREKFRIGPLQLQRVVDALGGAQVDFETVGVTPARLKALAQGKGDRDDLKALRPLAERIGDPFC